MSVTWTIDDTDREIITQEYDRRNEHDTAVGARNQRGMAAATPEEIERWGWSGVAAEYVFHLYSGLPWTGRGGGADNRRDVGPYEVKWSDWYGIILKRRQVKGEFVYTLGLHVLVTGNDPTFVIEGWYDVAMSDYFVRPVVAGNRGAPFRQIERWELHAVEDRFGYATVEEPDEPTYPQLTLFEEDA